MEEGAGNGRLLYCALGILLTTGTEA